jgi:hypothetical protein
LGSGDGVFVSDEISSANPNSLTTQNSHDDVSSSNRSSSSDKTFRGKSSATNKKSYSDRALDPDFRARAAGNTLGPCVSLFYLVTFSKVSHLCDKVEEALIC